MPPPALARSNRPVVGPAEADLRGEHPDLHREQAAQRAVAHQPARLGDQRVVAVGVEHGEAPVRPLGGGHHAPGVGGGAAQRLLGQQVVAGFQDAREQVGVAVVALGGDHEGQVAAAQELSQAAGLLDRRVAHLATQLVQSRGVLVPDHDASHLGQAVQGADVARRVRVAEPDQGGGQLHHYSSILRSPMMVSAG